MSPADLNSKDFQGHTHFYVERYALFNRPCFLKALEQADAFGLEIHLDFASPEVVQIAKEILPELFQKHIHTVYANEMKASAISGSDNPGEGLEYLSRLCPLAVVKLGERGAILSRQGGGMLHVCAKTVNAVDTTGADDLWASGFLHGYMNDWSLEECGAFASEISTAVVQVIGSVIPPEDWTKLNALATSNNKIFISKKKEK